MKDPVLPLLPSDLPDSARTLVLPLPLPLPLALPRQRRPRGFAAGPGRQRGRATWVIVILLAVIAAGAAVWHFGAGGKQATTAAAAGEGTAAGDHGVTPALTITVTRPKTESWSRTLAAQGSIAAWQEAVIGPEVGGMRIAEVRANVGDQVSRGDLLATLVPTTLANDLASQEAALAEARAALAEARADAERARKLDASGAISAQQISQYLTAERTAKARLAAAEARLRTDRLRLSQAELRAPDDGVISVRLATPGAVAQAGQELFRLIRDGRLEWRAEVPAADLGRIQEAAAATVVLADGSEVAGRVRVIAPTVDPMTRNGLVYVDLEGGDPARQARAGMFARGRFSLGEADALTLPAAAVGVRDGFAFVFRRQGDRVEQVRVVTGRRQGDRVEIVDGLGNQDEVAATGVGFLADGDVVAVVAGVSGTAGAAAPVAPAAGR